MLQNSRCVDVETVATICGGRSAFTLILHGDDDQIVPIGASAMLSCKIVKNATLKVYKGAPHGMCTTHKNQVNADLLAFIKG
jgi:non-heme chloroperoxidase